MLNLGVLHPDIVLSVDGVKTLLSFPCVVIRWVFNSLARHDRAVTSVTEISCGSCLRPARCRFSRNACTTRYLVRGLIDKRCAQDNHLETHSTGFGDKNANMTLRSHTTYVHKGITTEEPLIRP